MSKTYLPALHKFMNHLISTIWTLYFKLDLDLQTWNYEKIGLNLVNDQKKSWKTRAKIALIGQKIALIGQKMPKLKLFRFFMISLQFKYWIFMFFCEFRPCLNSMPIAMQNHLWMRNYILGMGASQIYSVISSPHSCFVVLTLLICREVAGYCGTLWESFFWDFSIMHPLIHAI